VLINVCVYVILILSAIYIQGTELGGGTRKGQSNEAGQDEDDEIDMKIFQNSSDRYALFANHYILSRQHDINSDGLIVHAARFLQYRSV
jgi:hypothetical protein